MVNTSLPVDRGFGFGISESFLQQATSFIAEKHSRLLCVVPWPNQFPGFFVVGCCALRAPV